MQHDPRPPIDDDPQEPEAGPRHLAIRSGQRLVQLLTLNAPSVIVQQEMDVLQKRVEEALAG